DGVRARKVTGVQPCALPISPRWCMEISNVELVSTTEDPVDDLHYHIAMQKDETLKTRVITAFRPDKAMFAAKPGFGSYMEALGKDRKSVVSGKGEARAHGRS